MYKHSGCEYPVGISANPNKLTIDNQHGRSWKCPTDVLKYGGEFHRVEFVLPDRRVELNYVLKFSFCTVQRTFRTITFIVCPQPVNVTRMNTERTYFRKKTDNSGSLKGLLVKAASLITHVQQAEPSIICYLSFTRSFEKLPQSLDITHNMCMSVYGRLAPKIRMDENDGALAPSLSLRCRSGSEMLLGLKSSYLFVGSWKSVCIHDKKHSFHAWVWGRLHWLLKRWQTSQCRSFKFSIILNNDWLKITLNTIFHNKPIE